MSGFKLVGKIKNGLAFEKKLANFQKSVLAGQVKAMQQAVFLIHETAVKSIQDNSSGTPQVRYTNGRKRVVLASKPGSPPNTDTGRLVQSIKFDFKNNGLTGRVGTNLRYGAHLEFGTKDMKKRPWLSAAIKEVSKTIGKIFKDALKDNVRGKK